MLNEALSFGMAVIPWSSSLMIVIKVIINEVNSVTSSVGALQFWYQSKGYEFLAKVMSPYLRFMSFYSRLWGSNQG